VREHYRHVAESLIFGKAAWALRGCGRAVL
jgi:hypothetical protein